MVCSFILFIVGSGGVDVDACVVEFGSDAEVTALEQVIDPLSHCGLAVAFGAALHDMAVVCGDDDPAVSPGLLDFGDSLYVLSHAKVPVLAVTVRILVKSRSIYRLEDRICTHCGDHIPGVCFGSEFVINGFKDLS